jgi:uncharacterized repeat protein (TIGR01451 family)
MLHWIRTAAGAAGLAAALLGVTAPAQAADEGPLAITVVRDGDPGASIHEGDSVAYAITVENTGDESYVDLRVSHLLPAGFTLRDADPAPDRAGGRPGWTVSLDPGERIDIATSVVVGTSDQIEQGQLVVVEQPDQPSETGTGTAFTTTVCVAAADHGTVLGCASDQAALLDPEPPINAWWWWAAAVAAAAVAVGAFLLGRRIIKARKHV